MIYETTNLPEPTRRRLLEETNQNIAMLEDRCRLLDEVIALRQERDALLSARRRVSNDFSEKGMVENRNHHVSNYTPSTPYVPSTYRAYHVSPCGVRPMPMVFTPVAQYSPQYIPQSASYTNKHPSPVPSQPQQISSGPTLCPPKMPSLVGSKPALNENMNHKNSTTKVDSPSNRTLPHQNRKLSSKFHLLPNTVVLGKGKQPKEAMGNMRLKELVKERLEEYTSSGRHGKMMVISKIIEQIQSENIYSTGQPAPAFVRFQDNAWWEVTEKECRIKLSATFRDLLAGKYRSSSKSKVEFRRQQRRHKREVSEFVDAIRALKTLKA